MGRTLLIIVTVFIFLAVSLVVFNMPAGQGVVQGPAQSTDSEGSQIANSEGPQTAGTDELQSTGADFGLISFKTQDIYGGEYTQDIFKDYSLTLVNVWGTYCGPCLDEMPALGELYDEYAPQRVNIVGIVIDVQDENLQVDEGQLALAQEIAEKTGADYTHLLISEEMIDMLNNFSTIPTSFFVDSDGNIVSEFYIGSKSKEEWTDLIETNLKNLE